jgi:hypothetical protein
MSVDQVIAGSLTRDELRTVVSMLCARFPERSRAEVEGLVTDSYQRLSDDARIRAHLIPLTLNRCRRLLSEGRRAGQGDHDGGDVRPRVTAGQCQDVDLVVAAV